MSVSTPASLWYATSFVVCGGLATALAGPAVTLSAVEGSEGTVRGLRGSWRASGVHTAVAAADLGEPAPVATLRLGGRRALLVAGGLRVGTLAGWRTGTAATPDETSGGGGIWAVRPSISQAAPQGAALGAAIFGHRLVVALAPPDTATARVAWLVSVGAREHGVVWELTGTDDDGGVVEAAAGARAARDAWIVAVRAGKDGRRAWRVHARSTIGRHRLDVSWERTGDRFEGLLGTPRSGWRARLAWPGAGVAYGTRADGLGSGLHAWARPRIHDMALRVDARAPRSGATSLSMETGTEVPRTGWSWRARARVRSEESQIGVLTGMSARGEALGLAWRLRADHAAAAPAWTAVYLGGGLIRPVRLVAGQRVVSIEARRGSWTVRLFEAAAFEDATRRAGVSIAWAPRQRGDR